MAELIDSGSRREFDSGAVRDISDEKGRCDLMPLDILDDFISPETPGVLYYIDQYIYHGSCDDLIVALKLFNDNHWKCMMTMFLETSIHYEDGAKKYTPRNWEKGIPIHCYIDSGVRHYLKFLRGDTDEPHDRAFVWNILCAIRTHHRMKNFIDLPFYDNITKKEIDIHE